MPMGRFSDVFNRNINPYIQNGAVARLRKCAEWGDFHLRWASSLVFCRGFYLVVFVVTWSVLADSAHFL